MNLSGLLRLRRVAKQRADSWELSFFPDDASKNANFPGPVRASRTSTFELLIWLGVANPDHLLSEAATDPCGAVATIDLPAPAARKLSQLIREDRAALPSSPEGHTRSAAAPGRSSDRQG